MGPAKAEKKVLNPTALAGGLLTADYYNILFLYF
jgi:hypothetical protein